VAIDAIIQIDLKFGNYIFLKIIHETETFIFVILQC